MKYANLKLGLKCTEDNKEKWGKNRNKQKSKSQNKTNLFFFLVHRVEKSILIAYLSVLMYKELFL